MPSKARIPLRLLAVAISTALFAYLVWRAGPAQLWQNVRTLGWGFTLVIALAGVSHFAKTWAWRLTLGDDRQKLPFSRMMGLRLGAEAAGQLGIVGQTFGDSIRIARMGPEIATDRGLASVSLDRGFYLVTGTMILITGILMALPLVSVSHALRLYASLFVFSLIAFLLFAGFAVRRRWPLLSASARALGRISFLKNWIDKRYVMIQAVEKTLLDFHHKTPKAFWTSFSLNLAGHCMAIAEVCLILWLMGVNIGFFGALVVEALTKLVNVIGNINPGNIGTFEGGTMLIGKMFGLGAATGLSLGLSRRLRAFFWTAVGAVWLFMLMKQGKRRHSGSRKSMPATPAKDVRTLQAEPQSSLPPVRRIACAILFANPGASSSQIKSATARVGSLPILLRTILAAQKAGASQIMIVINPMVRRIVQRDLMWTGRLPGSVQWIETDAGGSLLQRLRLFAISGNSNRLVLVNGNTTYHPSLLRQAMEWDAGNAVLALTSGDQPLGIYALPIDMIRDFDELGPMIGNSLEERRPSLMDAHSAVSTPVPEDLWQRVNTPEDIPSAERKLDRWLVKPTDGIFARWNRRISIPISRQLIKFPVTANMVSIFTLGVGFASALFFAFGGYWDTLLGALLCLCASILDGCDGEVARLKLLESDFGCWLETVCDYLFYLFLFVGMTLGLWKSSGTKMYLVWGALLLFGALASFLAIGWERHRLAAGRPEQLLKIWQGHAASRASNPFLYFARHAEFIVRRCFFPYALLLFALLNIMSVAFILSALGANLVWPIALYSSRTFAGGRRSIVVSPAVSA